MPGCEGAKVKRTEQVALPGRSAGQLVVKVKSPVRPRVRGKGWAPELPIVTVWGGVGGLGTARGWGKVIGGGVRVRLGLTDARVVVGGGRVVPVMRTERPWSSVRGVESAEGAWGGGEMIWGW